MCTLGIAIDDAMFDNNNGIILIKKQGGVKALEEEIERK